MDRFRRTKRSFTISATDDTILKVEKLATSKGLSRSAMVEELLDHAMTQQEGCNK